jgi:cytochrome c-type biogenesis protein CcmH/NrfF
VVRALAAVLLALGLQLAAPAAWAEEGQGWSYEIAHELMSPYCPGRTLAECPSSQADTLRMWLHVQEASGRPVEEVKAELVERFGEKILSAPRPEGFGLAAYVVPVLAFLVGGMLVWAFLRKQTREAAARPPPAAAAGPIDPDLERLIDEDISR